MYKIKLKNQFKKDIKRIQGDSRKLKLLKDLLDNHLIVNGKVPSQYKPHPLQGNWKPHMECHILPDFLLIWDIDEENREVILARCGSHSELF